MPIRAIQFRKESTQEWVGVKDRDPADEDGVRLYGAGKHPSGYLEVLYENIPGNSWNQNRLNQFASRANTLAVTRIPLADLPDDDLDKTTDPDDYPRAYWDGSDYCSRAIEIDEVSFSEEI